MRATEHVRRTAITYFGFSTVGILGFIYGRTVPADTCAYLSISGVLLSFVSHSLFRRYTHIIEDTKELLLTLQVEIGARVYPYYVRKGISERDVCIIIHLLVGVVFLVTSVYYVRDASARHHLIFQSCSPYAGVAANDTDACPCGGYPTEIQGVCPIPDSTEKKDACKVIPFENGWTSCPIDSKDPPLPAL